MYLIYTPERKVFENEFDVSLTPGSGQFDVSIYCDLEAIGLCIQPARLREQLESIPLRPKWRLLHFRISGSHHEYNDIASKIRSMLYHEISFIRRGCSIRLGMDFDFGFPIPNVVHEENVETSIHNGSPPDSLQPPVPDSGYMSANSTEPNSNTSGAVDNENGGYLWPRVRIASPEELILFAHWAFGPRGLQHLQILAYGDFSYGYRHRESQILFCRKDAPIPKWFINSEQGLYLTDVHKSKLSFRLLYTNDDIFATMQNEMRCLAACPTENLLNHPFERMGDRVDSFRLLEIGETEN
ncbi:hypothetical protein FQN52_002672 [Onygenales sp. PD_12]|nr:hypothetical protein FQN52_002672 [Onygenales sp. PD_12]